MTEIDESALEKMYATKVYDILYTWLPEKKREKFRVVFCRSMADLLVKSVSFYSRNGEWRIKLNYSALFSFAFSAACSLKCSFDDLVKEVLQVVFCCDDLTREDVKLLRVIIRHSREGRAGFTQVWDDSQYGLLRVRNFPYSLSTLEDDGIVTVDNVSEYIDIETDVPCSFLIGKNEGETE